LPSELLPDRVGGYWVYAIAFDAEQHSTFTHAEQLIAAQPCLPAGQLRSVARPLCQWAQAH
jgi:hypothetical protein